MLFTLLYLRLFSLFFYPTMSLDLKNHNSILPRKGINLKNTTRFSIVRTPSCRVNMLSFKELFC